MSTQKVLIVDEDEAFCQRLQQALGAARWTILTEHRGSEALALAKQEMPDVILLNLSLPTMDGETVAQMLKLDPVTCTIPIIVRSNLKCLPVPLQSWAADAVASTATGPALVAILEHVLAKQKRHRPYVLIVDDEPDLVEILTAVLSEQGFAASGASNGQEALDVIRTVKPDAMLLDLEMPQINGWEVLAQLRTIEQWQDIRVVILTGKDQSAEDRQRGLSLGASAYLLKPCRLEEIVKALHSALQPSGPATR